MNRNRRKKLAKKIAEEVLASLRATEKPLLFREEGEAELSLAMTLEDPLMRKVRSLRWSHDEALLLAQAINGIAWDERVQPVQQLVSTLRDFIDAAGVYSAMSEDILIAKVEALNDAEVNALVAFLVKWWSHEGSIEELYQELCR